MHLCAGQKKLAKQFKAHAHGSRRSPFAPIHDAAATDFPGFLLLNWFPSTNASKLRQHMLTLVLGDMLTQAENHTDALKGCWPEDVLSELA